MKKILTQFYYYYYKNNSPVSHYNCFIFTYRSNYFVLNKIYYFKAFNKKKLIFYISSHSKNKQWLFKKSIQKIFKCLVKN